MKAFLIVLTVLALGSSVHAQDGELATARDLYASAAYEDALTLLNRLRGTEHPANQSRAIEQYRAFCLLALGRASDAERAIEAVVAAEPTYHPSESDVSPRVRSAFTDVRRRMLPAIIQQKYAESKAAFDRKEWSAAASGFSQVLIALADPDVAAEARQSPLSDLRTLAVGFEELSAKAAAPPPPPPPAPIAVAAPPTRPAPPRIYTVDDATVVAPVIVHQALPSFPGQVVIPRTGRIEITIDESGQVEGAVMTGSITSAYDSLVLNASRTWRYKPATVNGAPVKFKKTVQIAIRPTTL
jgi:TonB family protein